MVARGRRELLFKKANAFHENGLNLYIHVRNNPIAYVDPSGYMTVMADGGGSSSVQVPVQMQYSDMGVYNTTGTSNILLADKLPNKGEPNSKENLYNEDGSVKQERVYGPDGEPLIDRDWNHGGVCHEFPHEHEWKNKERQEGVPFVGPPPPPKPASNIMWFKLMKVII